MDHTRTTEWDDPRDLGRKVRERSGLEFLRDLITENRRVPNPHASISKGEKAARRRKASG